MVYSSQFAFSVYLILCFFFFFLIVTDLLESFTDKLNQSNCHTAGVQQNFTSVAYAGLPDYLLYLC